MWQLIIGFAVLVIIGNAMSTETEKAEAKARIKKAEPYAIGFIVLVLAIFIAAELFE